MYGGYVLKMPQQLWILQGVPGSGKSTVGDMLLIHFEDQRIDNPALSAIRLSTDDYRYGECGHYFYDPVENLKFHSATQRAAADEMRGGTNYIIIDNTNIFKAHAYPYIALAEMYGYEVNVLRVDPGLATSKKRNATRPIERRVPNDVIERMHAAMEQLL